MGATSLHDFDDVDHLGCGLEGLVHGTAAGDAEQFVALGVREGAFQDDAAADDFDLAAATFAFTRDDVTALPAEEGGGTAPRE